MAGLSCLQGQYLANHPVLMADSLIATFPLIVVFVLLQRKVLEGIALSGSKGAQNGSALRAMDPQCRSRLAAHELDHDGATENALL